MKRKILAAALACALLLTACGGTNPETQPVETAPAAVEAHQETVESESGMVTPPKAEKTAETPQKAQDEGMDYAATFFGE